MSATLAPMKTEISRFCQSYTEALNPLQSTLHEKIDLILNQPDTDDIKASLSVLSDVYHRMKSLGDKVSAQQAYVIIFGPLKSGKSTLMNAFSAAYVSEVTALPAYPCLVHVRHSEEESIVATRFNGKTERFRDYRQMQQAVSGYHKELADQIRKVEEKGETFDPGIHCPKAIRRLDISLPAEPLKSSYTVLVDTPGLYSRMKFGYDMMSREFRDSAACAIFVVKTDNLFLEQVFDEFNELLTLFSRIFLVVNIDTSKCDLGPDGSLVPSLESRDPQSIVDAFRDLSMSAPLRTAYDEGRLRIYPIDLLHAAKESLSGEKVDSGGDGTDVQTSTETYEEVEVTVDDQDKTGEVAEDEESSGEAIPSDDKTPKPVSFSELMSDLTNYLNSNEYLIHFLRDSLRQGRSLAGEIIGQCTERNLKTFIASEKSLIKTLEKENEQRAALGRLRDLNWDAAFQKLHQQVMDAADSFKKTEKDRFTGQALEKVEQWFMCADSLETLLADIDGPVKGGIPELARDFVTETLKRTAGTSVGGAELPADSITDLTKAGISLAVIRQNAMAAALRIGNATSAPEEGLNSRSMPVSRTFWDWILMRGMTKVRERIFGQESNPTQAIPEKIKQSRLGGKSRKAFTENLENMLERIFDSLPQMLAQGMAEAYSRSVVASIRQLLDKTIEELDREIPQLRDKISIKADIRRALANLNENAVKCDREIEGLETEFSHLHPQVREERQAEETAAVLEVADDSEK